MLQEFHIMQPNPIQFLILPCLPSTPVASTFQDE